MPEKSALIEVHHWEQEGYKPLVFSHDWQVALLNWEPEADFIRTQRVERHMQTDEVFILWRGDAVLISASDTGIHVDRMKPGVVYNVLAGSWHTVIASKDSSMFIVENRDTHLNDCEYREITSEEKVSLIEQLPIWAK